MYKICILPLTLIFRLLEILRSYAHAPLSPKQPSGWFPCRRKRQISADFLVVSVRCMIYRLLYRPHVVALGCELPPTGQPGTSNVMLRQTRRKTWSSLCNNKSLIRQSRLQQLFPIYSDLAYSNSPEIHTNHFLTLPDNRGTNYVCHSDAAAIRIARGGGLKPLIRINGRRRWPGQRTMIHPSAPGISLSRQNRYYHTQEPHFILKIFFL